MGILRSIRRRFHAPPEGFYGEAKRVRRVPPAELAVAQAALAGAGPAGERMIWQLRETHDVWRLVRDDGSYELRVSATKGIRGVPRAGWTSEPIPVSGLPSGRKLEIRLVVTMAGIVELHGRSSDGRPWPTDWSVSADDLESIQGRAPWMRLPTNAELREARARAITAIESWLGEPGGLKWKRGVVSVEPPTTDEGIAAFERDQGFSVPGAYRDLLLVANGIQIGSLVVMGIEDAYRLDISGPDRLIISPPNEDGAYVLAPTGEVRFVELEDATSEGRVRAPDLREWVRNHVKPRRSG